MYGKCHKCGFWYSSMKQANLHPLTHLPKPNDPVGNLEGAA